MHLRVQHIPLINLMGLMTFFERKFFRDFGPLFARMPLHPLCSGIPHQGTALSHRFCLFYFLQDSFFKERYLQPAAVNVVHHNPTTPIFHLPKFDVQQQPLSTTVTAALHCTAPKSICGEPPFAQLYTWGALQYLHQVGAAMGRVHLATPMDGLGYRSLRPTAGGGRLSAVCHPPTVGSYQPNDPSLQVEFLPPPFICQ